MYISTKINLDHIISLFRHERAKFYVIFHYRTSLNNFKLCHTWVEKTTWNETKFIWRPVTP
jgi:hypothetical protein